MKRLQQTKPFLCVGGANLDRKIQSLVPLQLETSNPAVSSQSLGGVARNIAENLSRMGAVSALYTVVGDDAEGKHILTSCQDAGIDIRGVASLRDVRTGNYTAILDSDGALSVAVADMHIYDLITPERVSVHWHQMKLSRIVIADTNLPGDTLDHLIQQCQRENVSLCIIPVSAPKARRLPEDLTGVQLLILNRDELSSLTANRVEDKDRTGFFSACRSLQRRGCRNIIVTQGKNKVFTLTETGEFFSQPVPEVSVAEVTGAGDAFASGVLFGQYELNLSLKDSIQLGSFMAKATLQCTETVSPKITPQWIEQWQTHELAGGDISTNETVD